MGMPVLARMARRAGLRRSTGSGCTRLEPKLCLEGLPGIEGQAACRHNGNDVSMRTLIIVPIVHSREDMGSLAPESRRGAAQAARLGAAFWSAMRERIESLDQDWNGVKVYQDGLPDTVPELVDKIVASAPGQNYRLLRWLAEHGATVLGTEHPKLLMEEHTLLKAISDASGPDKPGATAAYTSRAPALLDERDSYIARRIDITLDEGQRGLLFVGAAHQVEKKLPRDIVAQRFDT
jgi:hypothetical protein